MNRRTYAACDLGAESGRVMLGTLSNGRLTLEEIHRFSNGAIDVNGTMRWDVERIFDELQSGLQKIADRKHPLASLSVDSWGVDYAWFSQSQPLIAMPFHYRDPRTHGPYDEATSGDGREVIFAETGIQFMPINSLYQLMADVRDAKSAASEAESFLPIADYLNYRFSGVAKSEVSLASTTQIYNPIKGAWSSELIERFELPANAFPEVVESGTKLGPLEAELSERLGLPNSQVVATCSHDTGAAVAAVPASQGDDWAYLSSGTWSLIGVELPSPLINDRVQKENYTNEAGYGGTTRFLKNIVGLWLLQESRRSWAGQGNEYDYSQLNQLAGEAEPLRSLVHPNDPRFMAPDDMPTAIADYCRETNQPVPETPGQFTRCVLESLAFLYGEVLDTIESLTGRTIKTLHIVGGGSQSDLLNQFSANATGRTVIAGPVEATAAGNVLLQAIAMGDLSSLHELRTVVRDSFPVQTYTPQPSDTLEQAVKRFSELPC